MPILSMTLRCTWWLIKSVDDLVHISAQWVVSHIRFGIALCVVQSRSGTIPMYS